MTCSVLLYVQLDFLPVSFHARVLYWNTQPWSLYLCYVAHALSFLLVEGFGILHDAILLVVSCMYRSGGVGGVGLGLSYFLHFFFIVFIFIRETLDTHGLDYRSRMLQMWNGFFSGWEY